MISLRLRLVPGLTGVLGVLGVLGAACSSADEGAAAPPGISCAATASAADGDAARAALAGAAAGGCVVLDGASFVGPLTVPAGVALVAASGARATVTSTSADAPAITLGEGSTLAFVDVKDAASVGVAVRAGSATISDVTVTGARSAALAVRCTGCEAGTVSMSNVSLAKSGLGLWVHGAHVAWRSGKSAEHGGESLTAAAGVVATAGARLELDGVTVEKNQGVGVLVDGAKTTASIRASTVAEGERGVWVQRVAGTLAAPSVTITESQLVRNKIVGLGAVESRGIIIVGGRVAESVLAPAQTDLSTTEQIGDGVGIFSGTTDVRIDGTAIEQNGRAAGLVDKAGQAGIIIVGGKIAAGASGLKFVVQSTAAGAVQVSDADTTTPSKPLGVSAPLMTAPSLL